MLMDNMSQASFDQIANMSFAHVFRNSKPDPTRTAGIFSDQNHKAPFRALSSPLNAGEFVAFFDSPI
jgi:hypothetical protein